MTSKVEIIVFKKMKKCRVKLNLLIGGGKIVSHTEKIHFQILPTTVYVLLPSGVIKIDDNVYDQVGLGWSYKSYHGFYEISSYTVLA